MAGRGLLPRGFIRPGPPPYGVRPPLGGPLDIPPHIILEDKLAAQHAELKRLSVDNQRLAATHIALRQELATAQEEVQRLRQVAANAQVEDEAKTKNMGEKLRKLESEILAAQPLKIELQKVQAEAAKLLAYRQEVSSQIQQLTKELMQLRNEAQQLPAMKADADALALEITRARTAFEMEKKKNTELLEQRQLMEKNLVSMARDVEKLRAELVNAEKKARGSNMYEDSYGLRQRYLH